MAMRPRRRARSIGRAAAMVVVALSRLIRSMAMISSSVSMARSAPCPVNTPALTMSRSIGCAASNVRIQVLTAFASRRSKAPIVTSAPQARQASPTSPRRSFVAPQQTERTFGDRVLKRQCPSETGTCAGNDDRLDVLLHEKRLPRKVPVRRARSVCFDRGSIAGLADVLVSWFCFGKQACVGEINKRRPEDLRLGCA